MCSHPTEKIASPQVDVNEYFFTVILQMKLRQKPAPLA